MNLRRPCSSATLLALFLAGMMPLSIRADYLKNTDLAEGFACWHGDGDPAFLNPDGTEGAEGDKGVVAVIKIPLSPDEPRAVYQEYDTGTDPKSEDIKVQVFASSDFKRSTVPGDYTPNAECKPGDAFGQAAVVVPNVDFWLRAGPGFFYKTSALKPGGWTSVDGYCDTPLPGSDRTVWFCVPPGQGTIYLKAPSVTP
jgi:hypothetical protein